MVRVRELLMTAGSDARDHKGQQSKPMLAVDSNEMFRCDVSYQHLSHMMSYPVKPAMHRAS